MNATKMSPDTIDRNVILIILDTVRKDFFDQYATRVQTRSETSFAQCRSASTWSVESHASILTGALPSVHKLHADTFRSGRTFADLRGGTFLETLNCQKLGYSANPYANSLFDFDLHFDEFHDFVSVDGLFPAGLSEYEFGHQVDLTGWQRQIAFMWACMTHEFPLRSLANVASSKFDLDTHFPVFRRLTDDGASALLASASGDIPTNEPFVMFLNLMDAHIPLYPRAHFDEDLHSAPRGWSTNEIHKWDINKDDAATSTYLSHYRSLYAAAIDYLDRQVARFADEVATRTDRETTIIVTADHGHNLGYPAEDGLVHHDGSMSEGVLHVPLEVINPPPGWPESIPKLFSHLRLGDLIRSIAAGDDWDDSFTSTTIPAEVFGLGGTGDARDYREFGAGEYEYWDRLIRCVYTGGDGTIVKHQWDSLGTAEMYRLAQTRPCWQDRTAESFDFRSLESKFFSAPAAVAKASSAGMEPQRPSMEDDRLESHLRSLGYM